MTPILVKNVTIFAGTRMRLVRILAQALLVSANVWELTLVDPFSNYLFLKINSSRLLPRLSML